MQLTQAIVAEHLDLSRQQVSQLLGRLGVDLATASLDRIRIAYVRHLRAMAAGHGGDELLAERLRLTAARRGKAELELRERTGELVEAAGVRRGIVTASAMMRAALERIGDRLGPALAETRDHEACTNLVAAEIDEALRQLVDDLRERFAPPRAASDAGAGESDLPLTNEKRI